MKPIPMRFFYILCILQQKNKNEIKNMEKRKNINEMRKINVSIEIISRIIIY